MNRATFIDLVRYWIVIAIGIFLAANIVDGISYDSGTALIVVVLLLSIFNIFLKPIFIITYITFYHPDFRIDDMDCKRTAIYVSRFIG
jgi:hypothetical protein